jgi:hypothetical protein
MYSTYNVRDVLHCITDKGEVNLTIIEKYDNYIIVDNVIDGSDIITNGKIVDDFNILDKNYIYTLNISAPQQLHRIIMEQKNEINDLQTLLARLEAIINSSFIVDGTRTNLKRKARIIRNDTNKIRRDIKMSV